MIVSYNFKFEKQQAATVSVLDRGFAYGDGLFETLAFRNSNILNFKDHLRRLKTGMYALKFEGVEGLQRDVVKQQLLRLVKKNNIKTDARLKIQVWRKPGGLYTPHNLSCNILMMATPLETEPEAMGLKLGFSKEVTLYPSPLSRFKTCNALPYVLASIERKQSDCDDLILTDYRGHVAECTASNIFWVSKGQVYTPGLKTGCVAGVTRKNIIKKLRRRGFKVNKVRVSASTLLSADHVFTSNAAQVAHICCIGKTQFAPFEEIHQILQPIVGIR